MTLETKDPVLAWGEFGTVYRDGSFHDPNGEWFSASDMTEIKKHYSGANRINKPFPLLFYTDVMNGKTSNWFDTQGCTP